MELGPYFARHHRLWLDNTTRGAIPAPLVDIRLQRRPPEQRFDLVDSLDLAAVSSHDLVIVVQHHNHLTW